MFRQGARNRAEEGSGEQRDVYIPDYQYLVAPAHPHECDCLPEPVREPEPGGNRGRGDRGNGSQYGGCDCVLQADGSKAKGLRSPLFQ